VLGSSQVLPLDSNPGVRQVRGSRPIRGHDTTLDSKPFCGVGELLSARQVSAADFRQGEHCKAAQPLRLTARGSAGDECFGQAFAGRVEAPSAQVSRAF
jgi:hypothetical protein